MSRKIIDAVFIAANNLGSFNRQLKIFLEEGFEPLGVGPKFFKGR